MFKQLIRICVFIASICVSFSAMAEEIIVKYAAQNFQGAPKFRVSAHQKRSSRAIWNSKVIAAVGGVDTEKYGGNTNLLRWQNTSIEIPDKISFDYITVRFLNDHCCGVKRNGKRFGDRNLFVRSIKFQGKTYWASRGKQKTCKDSKAKPGEMYCSGTLQISVPNMKDANISVASNERPQKSYDICGFEVNGSGFDKTQLKNIQAGLQSRGLYKGGLDGVLGKGSCAGLSKFMSVEAQTKVFDDKVYSRLLQKPSSAALAKYKSTNNDDGTKFSFARAYVNTNDGRYWTNPNLNWLGVDAHFVGARLNNKRVGSSDWLIEITGRYQPQQIDGFLFNSNDIFKEPIKLNIATSSNSASRGPQYFFGKYGGRTDPAFFRSLSWDDLQTAKAACTALSDAATVIKIMDLAAEQNKFDDKHRNFWQRPQNIWETVKIAQTCLVKIAAIEEENASETVSSTACNQNRAIIRSNQSVLKDLGFYTSVVDGLSGPNYRGAVRSGEQLLGTRADDKVGCLNVPERQILSSIYDASRKGSQCKGLMSADEVKTTFEQLKASDLTKKISLGYANVGGLMWMIDTISDLEKRLSFTDFYKETKTSQRDCRLDRDEFDALGLKGSVNVTSTVVKTCEDDPALCSVVQLCGKAASTVNGDRAWNTDAKAAEYVALAKSTGVTCGVKPKPVAVAKAPTCEDDPALCSVVQLCGKAASTVNGDRAWNTDAKAADYVALAKSTGVTCGVKPKPVVVAKAPTCEDDPTKCSVIELCQQATGTNASGEKFWRMDAALQAYVNTAKSTGVTCGVVSKVIETAKLETCENTPSKCSLAELCQRAISFETGKLSWTTTISGAPYVQFAKNSGMTCGIQEEVVAAIPEQKQVEPPAPKPVQKYTNRKALVIGNANYVDQTPLKNPINDAKAVAAKLEQIGFEVTYKEDLEYREFGRTLGNFEREVSNSDISLIYYAGHGIEVDSVNYLIPVDAELSNPSDVKFETVMLDDAVGASLNTGKLSMVLVDACRDNPFAKSMSGGSRSIGRGLSIVDAQPGKIDQIISFAAESGEVAEDGSGKNSPYATALLELLDEPNLEVGKLFRKLGDNVERMTNGKQIPVTRNRLSGEDIFLVVE